MQSALRHFSLRVRLLVLSTVLVAILAATTIYVTAKLAANSRAVAHVTELAKLINLAHEVQVAFGEYRYWVTDLAVSFLSQSEQNAKDSLLQLTSKLDEFGRARPQVATDLKKELAQFELYAMRAVEQYTDDQRVAGNTMLARARQHSIVIEKRLSQVASDLNDEAAAERAEVIADVTETTHVILLTALVAIVVGFIITLIVLRSISRPLAEVVDAMGALTAGNLNVAIPATAPDEIGVMARTLSLFQDSIIERARLTTEAEERGAALRATFDNMSHGILMFDSQMKLAAWNRQVAALLDLPATFFSGASFVLGIHSFPRRARRVWGRQCGCRSRALYDPGQTAPHIRTHASERHSARDSAQSVAGRRDCDHLLRHHRSQALRACPHSRSRSG